MAAHSFFNMKHVTAEALAVQLELPMPPVVTADLTGKIVVITGANIGLGLEAAKHLARMNPKKLVITVRSQEKGEETVKGKYLLLFDISLRLTFPFATAIEKETGFKDTEIGILELSSFDSVKKFVETFEQGNHRLDILLENAAYGSHTTEMTTDGWDKRYFALERSLESLFQLLARYRLQVNALSPHLLAILLLPIMVRTAEAYKTRPRLIMVTSVAHQAAPVPFDVLENGSKGFHQTISGNTADGFALLSSLTPLDLYSCVFVVFILLQWHVLDVFHDERFSSLCVLPSLIKLILLLCSTQHILRTCIQ
jgi:retinol dehydrogenase 12